MHREVMARIAPGQVYELYAQRENGHGKEPYLVGTYKVLCFACDALKTYGRRCATYVVVYEGLTGPDRGMCFVAGLHNFATHFRPEPGPPPPPGKAAGYVSESAGY